VNDHANTRGDGALRDYIRALRRSWWIILALIAIGVGGGLLLASTEETTYEAKAIVLFQDPNEDLSLVGTASGVFRTAQQRAQIGADTIVTPELARKVKRRARARGMTPGQVKSHLSASADAASSQVFITADAPTAGLAARLANAAADAGAAQEAATERRRFSRAADRIQAKVKALGNSKTDPTVISQRATYNSQITRLRSLSEVARPVVVSKRATVPDSPTSPKPIRDAIIGGVLGLILGLIVTVIRETLNRRLSSTADVEEQLELPVLAHVGKEAMGRAGLSHSGLGALNDHELEAFRILRTNLRVQNFEDPPKTVLVTSPMPEEGKSTVAASLAFSNAMGGRRTLLIECDFRRPSLAERLGVSPTPGLIDFLLGDASREEIVLEVPDSPDAAGTNGAAAVPRRAAGPLSVVVAGHSPKGQAAELFESPAFGGLISELARDFDNVVIDTPPLLPVADTLEILQHVDAVVLCVRAAQTTRQQASAGKAALEPVQERVAGVVVTGVAPRDRGYYGYYGYYGYASRDAENGNGHGYSGRLRRRLGIGGRS
jgi:Mrp family chromosome partitioning ATPase/capsular polysaccharide biosynthesis protein